MKRLTTLFVIFSYLAITASFSQEGVNFKIIPEVYDFGNIKEETGSVHHDFRIQNTGDSVLIIKIVTASCGCTTPEWTKNPILPGQYGTIRVKYNTIGRLGIFTKSVYIYTSASEEPSMVVIKGNVIGKEIKTEQ